MVSSFDVAVFDADHHHYEAEDAVPIKAIPVFRCWVPRPVRISR